MVIFKLLCYCLNIYTSLAITILQEENRARDLFYALWVPDLFMERVQSNGVWSLFCPSEAPGLADCWGEEFEKLYTQYEREVSSKLVNLFIYLFYLHSYHWFDWKLLALTINSTIFLIFMNSGQGKKGCEGARSLV